MQLGLFGGRDPVVVDRGFGSLKRRILENDAWVDYAPSWLSGHEDVFDAVMAATQWRQTQQVLFEQTVDTPRRVASYPDDGAPPSVVRAMAAALSDRYGVRFDRLSAALYRDGRDSVAWHRDREHRERRLAIVAIVSLGAPRRFALRPRERKEETPSINYQLGWGDQLVMGGTAQRTWEHAVPKAPRADPRISLMFRHHPDAFKGADAYVSPLGIAC